MKTWSKLNKNLLKLKRFIPKSLKVQMPRNSFKFYSIEVNWFSKDLKDIPKMAENPENFLDLIEEVSEEKNQFSWLIILK